MNLKSYLRTGSAAVIAAALSFGALPSVAHADDNSSHRRGHETRGGDSQQRGQSQQRAQSAPQRTYQAPQQQRTYRAPAVQQRSGRDSDRGDNAAARSGRDWNRGASQAQAAAQAQARARQQVIARSSGGGNWSGRNSGSTAGTESTRWDRNRTYSNPARNQTYRQGSRDGRNTDWRQDRQQTQNAYRSGYRDGNRTSSYRDRDHREWNHDWRRDNRYNWSSYRHANRNVYHLGRYYSPYSNYRYSRLSIGFRLNSLFFGSRYWINDPWQYRLPEAYGPYRWVRYYDDALLVDIYSGEVVDVIYDFFW